jgi:hypothetical protein
VLDARHSIPRVEDGDGVKFGQRSTFHPGIALSVGYDSNIFYESAAEGPRGAAFIVPSAWMGVGNRAVRDDGVLDTPAERTSRAVDYNLKVAAGFRQYLSRLDRIKRQSRVTFGFLGRVAFLPGRRFSIHLDEDLYRLAEPPNFEAPESFEFDRISHSGRLLFIGRPGGGRFSIAFGYLSGLVYFESGDVSRSDRLINGAIHETKWRFLPRTALLVRYTFRHTYYLHCCAQVGSGRNEDNFAHRLLGGLRGQVGQKVVLEALVGWGWGYYRDDPNGPDFDSFIGQATIEYYPTPRTQIAATFARTFRDSLLGNYMDDIGGRLLVQHEFRWRMLASADLGVTGRTYKGLPGVAGSGGPVEDDRVYAYEGIYGDVTRPDRRDVLFVGGFRLEQPLGRLWAVAASYRVALDSTKFKIIWNDGFEDPGGFVKHVVLVSGALRF